MARRLAIGAILFGSFAGLSEGTQAQPVPIPEEVKQRWYVDEADDLCFMSHALDGGSNHRLTVQTYPGSQLYDLVLDSDAWPARELQITDSRLELRPIKDLHWHKTLIDPSRSASGKAIRVVELPGSFLLNLAKATSLELSNAQLKLSYAIPTGIAVATNALVECQVMKMIEWGADPSGFGIGATPVKVRGDPREWFGQDFFDKPKSYRIAVRMLVSPDGHVEKCDFLRSSVSEEEKTSACKAILETARFTPARNPKGAPVRSVYVLYGNIDRYRMWQHLPED